MALLYKWAREEKEPLRTYAAGILASAAEHQDINVHYNAENAVLVNVLS